MKITLPYGEVYIFTEEEAEDAIDYFRVNGLRAFKKHYKHKKVNKDETANI